MEDIINNLLKDDKEEKINHQFPIKECRVPGEYQYINILSMSASKKYIYLIEEHGELLFLDSKTLNPFQFSFKISSFNNIYNPKFKENFTKIWTDREGNHNIIRYKEKNYYFNILNNKVEELNSLKNIEIGAVGFDDINENQNSTGIFLVADYNNNIYECEIKLEQKRNGDYKILEYFKKLTTLVFKNWDTEEDEDEENEGLLKPKKDRIYGIKFIKSKRNNELTEKYRNNCYIIFVTKTKLYQFHKTNNELTFIRFFGRFNWNAMLFNDMCKYFPEIPKISKKFTGTDIDFLYNSSDEVDQFGWKTESGFCFGYFDYDNYSNLPKSIEKFIVIPFEKINKNGKKIPNLEPLSVTHSQNHIFILYDDCLTIVSKLNYKIIHTEYLEEEFTGILFNEFSEENGTILLYSKNGLFKISLKDENKNIWEDYLDIGDYTNAIKYNPEADDKLIRKINRINADENFESKNFSISAKLYPNSDEKFEIVVLKYLLEEKIDSLQLYCLQYLKQNKINNKNNSLENILLLILICEIMFKNPIKDKEEQLKNFSGLIRENTRYFKEKNIKDFIYFLALQYNKEDEFTEYASIIGD